MPTLLYGAESWILNITLLQKLESFQAEIAKQILRLPKHKLCFLLKIIKNDDTLSSCIFHALAAFEVESLHLVRQCHFLESPFQTNLTSTVLLTPDETSSYQLKKEIINRDWLSLLSEAAFHPFQCHIQAVAANPDGSWPKVWDTALNKGAFGTTCAAEVSQPAHSL